MPDFCPPWEIVKNEKKIKHVITIYAKLQPNSPIYSTFHLGISAYERGPSKKPPYPYLTHSVVEQCRGTRLARNVENVMIICEAVKLRGGAFGVGPHLFEI